MDSIDDGSSVEADRQLDAPRGSFEAYGEGIADGHASSGGDRFHWRASHTLFSILALILVAAVIAWFIQLPYYALTPGSAPQVSSLIKVPSADHHSHRGSVLLVYVELTPMRALYYPFFWLDSNAAIYPSSAILGTESAAAVRDRGRDRHVDGATGRHGGRPASSSATRSRSPRSGRSSTASCPARRQPRRFGSATSSAR